MRFLRCLACVLLLALTLSCCASPKKSAQPITQRVYASVTAISGEDEYHLSVEKDSDTVATYTFSFPTEVDGLTYSYVGENCTVSFHGLTVMLEDCPNGVADILHTVLSTPGELSYQQDTHTFLGSAEKIPFRIFTLSDGNISAIHLKDDDICYYFDYSP